MLKKIVSLLLFLLVGFSIVTISAQDTSPAREKNILILHSYHQGLEWTDHISSGIQDVFKNRIDVNLVFEYLDTKRFFNQEYFNSLIDFYKSKARNIPFDVIIACDNTAYNFMTTYQHEFYPGVPIVFCGVNFLDTIALKENPTFYGFMEKTDHKNTLQSIQKIFPTRKNILIINDNTVTGQAIRAELEESLPLFKNELNIEIYSDLNLKNIQDKVKSLDDTYAIYLLVINRDNEGNFISYRKGINAIGAVSKVPIFGSWDFYINKGLFGGRITSGFDQGKEAGLLAEEIIDKGVSQEMKQYNDIENKYIFDYAEMSKFGVSENQLPSGSLIINAPEKQNILLKAAIIISIILILFLLILSIRLKYLKRREAILFKLVKEKTQELSQTNNQLEDVIKKKDQFFSILAHDLRNSIGVLLNSSILINDPEFCLKTDELKRIKKNLLNSAQQTSDLLEDLLYWGMNQFQKAPAKTMEEFDLEEILKSITKTYEINTNNVGFSLVIEPNITCINDANICKFIYRNIIQNAIKYSHDKGMVRIIAYTKNNQTVVSVTDMGIGMDAAVIESIYNKTPIKRGGQIDKKNTGLGLPTVLEYLESLGGILHIESEPEKGSTFTVKLPNQIQE